MAELEAKIRTLEVFESLNLEDQEQRIQNPENSNSNDYNLSDYELDNEFDFDFREDSDREEDNLEENHMERVVFDNILEYNTPKPYHSSFTYGTTAQLTQYSTLKALQIELLSPLIPKSSGYHTPNLSTPEALTSSLSGFPQQPILVKRKK